MIGFRNILDKCRYLFGKTFFLILLISALLYIYRMVQKRYRKIIIIAGICFLLIFNDITFALVDKFNASGEYYRFFWMIPICGILAVLAAYLMTKMDIGKKKVFALLIIIMAVLSSGAERSIADIQINRMDNIYNMPEEIMEIINIIDEDREGDAVVVLCSAEMFRYLRVYDGAYIACIPRTIYRHYEDFDFQNADADRKRAWLLLDSLNNAEHDLAEVKEALIETNVRYIICSKNSDTKIYEEAGGILLAETVQYNIYRLE